MENILQKTNSNISKSLMYMTFGLLTSAIVSYLTFSTGLAYYLISGIGWLVLSIAEIGFVLYFSFNFSKLSKNTSLVCFFGYSILNGITLSSIFMMYDLNTIFYIFLLTAALFFTLAMIAKYSTFNMTKISPYVLVFLIGAMVFSLLNTFIFKSPFLDTIICWAFLALFCIITVKDVQNMISFSDQFASDTVPIYFAFCLYLDFVNLFISILNLTSKRRR